MAKGSKVKFSIWADMQDDKIWQQYKAPWCFATDREREKSDHSNSMWHQHDSRNMDVIPPGTAQSVPFLHTNPLIKLWNRFGLHHDSMQSGTEQGSIISWHAGVRGCISPRAGAVLCQETSRFASTCRPGLHRSPEGNLMQAQKREELQQGSNKHHNTIQNIDIFDWTSALSHINLKAIFKRMLIL